MYLNPICLLLGYVANPCIYACVENVVVVANETATGWEKTVICYTFHSSCIKSICTSWQVKSLMENHFFLKDADRKGATCYF